jgi:4-aminobutyrate aminotransferase-like enzyme
MSGRHNTKHFDTNVLWAGLTYAGHPLACAAGVATVKAYRDERIIERGAKMGELLMKELRTIATRHPSVGDVRGKGLMVGIELVKDRGTKRCSKLERAVRSCRTRSERAHVTRRLRPEPLEHAVRRAAVR